MEWLVVPLVLISVMLLAYSVGAAISWWLQRGEDPEDRQQPEDQQEDDDERGSDG